MIFTAHDLDTQMLKQAAFVYILYSLMEVAQKSNKKSNTI